MIVRLLLGRIQYNLFILGQDPQRIHLKYVMLGHILMIEYNHISLYFLKLIGIGIGCRVFRASTVPVAGQYKALKSPLVSGLFLGH